MTKSIYLTASHAQTLMFSVGSSLTARAQAHNTVQESGQITLWYSLITMIFLHCIAAQCSYRCALQDHWLPGREFPYQ